MGDRYYLNLICAYCGKLNKDIYYAPTCNFYTFRCEHCDKYNFISNIQLAKKVEEVTYDEIKNAFFEATNARWDENDIMLIEADCKEQLEVIKNLNK